MIPKPSEAANALNLEFVADLSYNPRTNQYRIDLVEPFRSELPRTRNFLLVDVDGFTVKKVLEAFDANVIRFYQNKCDQARETLERVRRMQTEATNDSMSEW